MANDTRVSRYEKNKTKVSPKPPVKKQVAQQKKKQAKRKEKVQKQRTKNENVKIQKTKRRRIRYKNVFVALILFLFLGIIGNYFFSLPITNIYIEGNTFYSDQQVIELANLSNYPSNISVFPSKIEKKLEKEELIQKVKVKKFFRKITITITENKPLYYYESTKKTMLEDGRETNQILLAPTVINYIPNTHYDQFIKAMKKVKIDVLNRISEIKYDPDEVDDGRFLLSMKDGNYVYLTLTKWDAINSYINIIKEFPNQKGILYLNAGNSFEVIEK